MSVRVYAARQMTGQRWAVLDFESRVVAARLGGYGIEVLDPVQTEIAEIGHLPKGVCGDDPLVPVEKLWARDKRMIRRAHVLLDLTPEAKSEGVAHEIGYARYHLWKPIVRVYQEKDPPAISIARFEDDLLTHSLDEAAVQIVRRWGTWRKRALWRSELYARCFPKAVWYRLQEWK